MRAQPSGMTLIECIVGVAAMIVATTALFGGYLGQTTLNEHARNLSRAMTDATRVMEELRQQNIGSACTTPTWAPPIGFAGWDAWLGDTGATGGGGKNVRPAPNANEELVTVTCRNQANTAACVAGQDPIRVTVAVCWRHRNRTLGECRWDAALSTLSADETVAVPLVTIPT